MSFNDIDDTLVAYFRQMLSDEASDAEEGSIDALAKVEELGTAPKEAKTNENLVAEEDIDYASDDYVPPAEQAEDEISPELQVQLEAESEVEQSRPYAEPSNLQSLLETVETRTETEVESKVEEQVETAVENKVEEQVETAVEEQVATETETAVEEQVETASDTASVQDTEVKAEVQEENAHEEEFAWKNIEMPSEFQALFFVVRGIRFAVPLVNLGGIFQSQKITPLFGKPNWFMGIADIRGRKMNVVDTLKWVKSDVEKADNYEYMIALDKTLWSIGCDELEGNRILSNDMVTWRQHAGNRPWLAGIVKKEMCALLHVEALIRMFENGVNLKDLDLQVSE
ncbi:MAG: chemotaxis protein CheW [Succinivibrio sp.]